MTVKKRRVMDGDGSDDESDKTHEMI